MEMLQLIFLYEYYLHIVFACSSGTKKKQLLVDKPDDEVAVNNYDDSYDDLDFMWAFSQVMLLFYQLSIQLFTTIGWDGKSKTKAFTFRNLVTIQCNICKHFGWEKFSWVVAFLLPVYGWESFNCLLTQILLYELQM